MAQDQNLTRQSIEKYSQRISDQVGTALTSEMSRNQKLNNNLQETQAVAADALKLVPEIVAVVPLGPVGGVTLKIAGTAENAGAHLPALQAL